MAINGAAHVEHVRRTDPILYIIEDRWTDTSSLYIGKTPRFTTLTSEAKWQIERITFDGSQLIREFANHGKWCNVWDDRATYFGPPGGVDLPGDVVSGNFTATLSGLNIAGKITQVAINDTGWTALPATPLAARNAMAVINTSGVEIKVEYDNTVPDYASGGVPIPVSGERYYDVGTSVIIYARSSAGAVTITVEELS